MNGHVASALLVLGIWVAFASSLPQKTTAADPVKVSVYYESLCPDSKRFVIGQLYPVWSDLKDIMILDVNTYGKAQDTPAGDGFVFECQHGPNECEGNMMLTCAKKHIANEEQFMAFTNCVMTEFVAAAAGEECAREAGVDFTAIDDCYNSVEGQQLLHEVGVIQGTLDPPLNYVPWILIDDVFTEEQLDAAQDDLRKVVCDTFQGEKPDLCNK